MDRIKITIEQDGHITFIEVLINGNEMPKVLDVETFFAIKQLNGLVPLFTCGCGEFGCGGYYVDVSCTDSALILRNSYHRLNRSLQSEFEYHLDWQQVRGIAQEILTYLEKMRERDPQAYVRTCEGGNNLLDLIPEFRKSSLLLP
ncbi:MAG: hypothetical protein JO202_07825 [Ktedonobacteraceae bacterium]|nr:hypothetical protein [Ktedonobacteraceae bacterium]